MHALTQALHLLKDKALTPADLGAKDKAKYTKIESDLAKGDLELAHLNEKSRTCRRALRACPLARRLHCANRHLANPLVCSAQAKADKKEAEQKKKDENADATRAMSDMGCRALCKIRLQHQTQMDNTSDKNDSVWATIVELFDQQVDSGEPSPSDRRSQASLRAK